MTGADTNRAKSKVQAMITLSRKDFYWAVASITVCLAVVLGIFACWFIPKEKEAARQRTEEKRRVEQKRIEAEKLQQERYRKTDELVQQRLRQEAKTAADSTAAAKSNQNNFKPEIRVLGDNLIVSNAGNETWKSVNVYVNSEPPFGYGCRLDNVKPLDSKIIPLTEFVENDGKRFNPNEYKVLYVCIGGGDYDYMKYGF